MHKLLDKSIAYAALLTLVFILLPNSIHGDSDEKRLLHHLLDNYNVLERPVNKYSDNLILKFGVTLLQILDVDTVNQILVTNLWLRLEWNDVNLRWNASEYGNITDIRIPPHRIWKPDILMYNSAAERFDNTYPTNHVVKNDGNVSYIPPGNFKSSCKMDLTWFPFDEQKCELKFGSWTYDGLALDLKLYNDTGDMDSFTKNSEWELLGIPAKRNVVHYACCPEPFVDATFTVHLRRRSQMYIYSLILPSILISFLAVLAFVAPSDSSTKLALGLFSLIGFLYHQSSFGSFLYPRNDNHPVLSQYFTVLMLMILSSIAASTFILALHSRSVCSISKMPQWFKKLLLMQLSSLLLMSIPNDIVEECNSREKKEENNILLTAENTSPLSPIEAELKRIADKLDNQDNTTGMINEWKFAAMVVDRLCLFIFSVFAILVSIIILATFA